MKLSQGKINETYVVEGFDDVDNPNHLINLGLYKGSFIRIKSMVHSSYIVMVNNARLAIAKKIADNIEVNPVSVNMEGVK